MMYHQNTPVPTKVTVFTQLSTAYPKLIAASN